MTNKNLHIAHNIASHNAMRTAWPSIFCHKTMEHQPQSWFLTHFYHWKYLNIFNMKTWCSVLDKIVDSIQHTAIKWYSQWLTFCWGLGGRGTGLRISHLKSSFAPMTSPEHNCSLSRAGNCDMCQSCVSNAENVLRMTYFTMTPA